MNEEEWQNPKWLNKNKNEKMLNKRERERIYKNKKNEKERKRKTLMTAVKKLPTSVFKCSQILPCSIHQTSLGLNYTFLGLQMLQVRATDHYCYRNIITSHSRVLNFQKFLFIRLKANLMKATFKTHFI